MAPRDDSLLHGLFDEAPIGVALVALDGTFLRVNTALAELLGTSAPQLSERSFRSVVHPDDHEVDRELSREIAAGARAHFQVALRLVSQRGAVIDAWVSVSVVRDGGGAAVRTIRQIVDVTEQRAAERALQELIDLAPDGILIANRDGRVFEANPAAIALTGYTREELLRMTFLQLVVPEDRARLEASRERLLAGSPEVGEWTLDQNGGTRCPVEVSARILPDGRWQAFVRDIAQRKRTEEALRQSQAQLARAQQIAHLGSWDWDLRTNVVQRSDEMCRLLGLDLELRDTLGWSFLDLVHPKDCGRYIHTVREAIRTGLGYEIDYRLVLDGGRERSVHEQAEAVLKDGVPIRFVGTVLDVTERAAAERQRADALRRLATIVEEAPVAIIIAEGARGERLEINARARELMGRTPASLAELARHVRTLPSSPASAALPSTRALRGEHVEGMAGLYARPDGREVPVRASAAPLCDADGTITGALIAAVDVTAERELEQLRAEWASVVAHDLRQPLSTILVHCDLIVRGNPSSSDALEPIRRSAARLDRMIRDLSDISRLEARRVRLSLASVDLDSLVRETLDPIARAEPTREFEVCVSGNLQPARLDPDRIAQVLENLLTNAIKYGRAASRITVAVHGDDDECHVSVTNEGEGIPEHDLARLFQRFQRADDNLGRVKGIGLGLYIARGLVTAHGGRMDVRSVLGETTTFRFTLPWRGPQGEGAANTALI